MSLISFPFNFNPDSVSVKTGSYTIPAGKYARVTPNVYDGGNFSIDSNEILKVDSLSINGEVSGESTGSAVIGTAERSDKIGIYAFWAGGSGSGDIAIQSGGDNNKEHSVVSVTGSGDTAYSEVIIGKDDEIVRNVNTSGVGSSFLWAIRSLSKIETQSYWVPTGAVLNISNGEYLVELYNITS